MNLEQEWSHYYPKVYGYFFRRVNHRLDVEDLTSISLTQFFKTVLDLEKSQRITNRNAYLWRIVHNQLVDFYERNSKQNVTVGLDEDIDGFDMTLENQRSSEYQDRVESLKKCISKQLSGVDLQIVELSLIEDRKSYEVAEMCNLKSDNVRQKLSRAVKKIKDKCIHVWQS